MPVLIDLKTVGTYSKKVNITFPEKTSPGSRRVTASVIGNMNNICLRLCQHTDLPYARIWFYMSISYCKSTRPY